MILKKYFALFIALPVLLFSFIQTERAGSRSLADGAFRTISLSPSGRDRANSVAFSPDGRQLSVGGSSGIYLFDLQSSFQPAFIETGTWARSLDFSPDGTLIAGGLFDNTLKLWSLPDLKLRRDFGDLGGWVRSVAFSTNGRLLAAAGGNALRVLDVYTGALQWEVKGLDGIRTLAISPNGDLVALGLIDNSIQLRSLEDGKLLRSMTGHEGWVRSLAFSPNGNQLASGAFDATARLWDVDTGRLQYTLTDHDSSVLGIDYSPDGKFLATGSVDQTVRIWDPAEGTLLKTLVGHTGFVYSVAFSPDGRMLASGSEDNSVRLWDLEVAEDGAAHAPETPSDCRACHHPLSTNNPVAVVDVRCDVCHMDGLGFNWCPFFPRSVGENYKMQIHTASLEEAGLAVPGDSLAVTIFSPSNGETIYSSHDFVAPLDVRGRLDGDYAAGEVKVHLEIWSGSELISSLEQVPQPNGLFLFTLGVNPDGNRLRINDPAAPFNCAFCHDDYFVQDKLPSGDLRLRVSATGPRGEQASDERWITVDVGSPVPLAVTVKDASTGKAVEGLTVQASTLLYEWRGRTSSGITLADGAADLELEALSQAPTRYTINIPEQVVNGALYSVVEPAQITIDPQVDEIDPVALEVTSSFGRITGRIEDAPAVSVQVWAIQLPGGPWWKAETDSAGGFTFAGLPIGKYLVFANADELAEQGLIAASPTLDLQDSIDATIALKALPISGLYSGTITAAGGKWLPFSWVALADGTIRRSDVKSGQWTTAYADGSDKDGLIASAPGYYSLRVEAAVLVEEGAVTAELEPRPDLSELTWGTGMIHIPSETQATIGDGRLEFESGWVWGSNPASAPFTIHTAQANLKLSTGEFALERSVGGIAWFYLFSGTAEVQTRQGGQIRTIQAGEMVPLTKEGADAQPYTAEVLEGLYMAEAAPVPPVWMPGFLEQVKMRINQIGVLFAQSVTFITYFIAVISLVTVPWLVLRWLSKHRSIFGEKNNGK